MRNRNIILTTILLALGFFALPQRTQAVSPAPDGGYPGRNTAEGQNALFSLTTGGQNTAIGWLSLRSNTAGNFNTAVGAGALLANVGDPSNGDGMKNTATGAGALLSNTTGYENTANGAFALLSNTTGNRNTANGLIALNNNTTGDVNTADGAQALSANTTGSGNAAIGDSALLDSTTGDYNTAIGTSSLTGNITGSGNIALGFQAGISLTTGNNNIDIGNYGIAGESNTIRIGGDTTGFGSQTATYIAGIHGRTASGGVAVYVNSNGRLGTLTSSARFKENIKSMDDASQALLALKPVTFRYKKEIDPAGTSQFGLVAEQVEKVNPDLVVRDEQGKPYSVRYEQINAMLLNEFLKEHKTVRELKSNVQQQNAIIAQQQKSFESRIAEQEKRIEALTSGLQK
jgi:hypothetical protein